MWYSRKFRFFYSAYAQTGFDICAWVIMQINFYRLYECKYSNILKRTAFWQYRATILFESLYGYWASICFWTGTTMNFALWIRIFVTFQTPLCIYVSPSIPPPIHLSIHLHTHQVNISNRLQQIKYLYYQTNSVPIYLSLYPLPIQKFLWPSYKRSQGSLFKMVFRGSCPYCDH